MEVDNAVSHISETAVAAAAAASSREEEEAEEGEGRACCRWSGR